MNGRKIYAHENIQRDSKFKGKKAIPVSASSVLVKSMTTYSFFESIASVLL